MIDHRPLRTGVAFQLPAKGVCAECPLSRACQPGALGGYSAQQYLEVLYGIGDLACHMSKGFNQHDKGVNTQRSCTGVAIFRRNVGHRRLAGNALAAADAVEPDTKTVFASPIEFAEHHDPALATAMRLVQAMYIASKRR